MSISLTELRSKQHQIMGNVVNRAAQDMQVRLVAETKEVEAMITGAAVLVPPTGTKDLEAARVKVNAKYGGDWLEIKDMARCTLVVEWPTQIETAIRLVRARFRASNGFAVIEEKVTLAAEDSAGYSGNSVIVSSGGSTGEIQINTPAMMYAKSLPEFLAAMPDKEAHMKATYPQVPGGLGHFLYETHRDKRKSDAVRQRYGNASRLYYNYFRSFPVSLHRGIIASEAISPLMIIRGDNSSVGALKRA
jgi:hypothetical protein